MSAWQSFTLSEVQNQGRRKFLKQTLDSGFALGTGLASSYFMSGCSSLDRAILGGAPKGPNEVVILGAGLAGLTTAYLCKKNGIPFSLYEGSSRVGGRVLTLREFNRASQSADLGGEWISPQHQTLISLAKELNVELSSSPFKESDFLFFEGAKKVNSQKLLAEIRTFQKKSTEIYRQIFYNQVNQLRAANRGEFRAAVDQDRVSCEELIHNLTAKSSEILPLLLQRQIELSYGAHPSKVSSLIWLRQLQEPNEFSILGATTQLRVSGGSSVLTQALFDRVSGVIPGRFVNLSHKLVSVAQDSGGFEIRFETPQGVKTVQANRVVSTLPISVFRKIKGVESLSLTDFAHEALMTASTGEQAKGLLSFTERPWKRLHAIRRFSGTWGSQNFWESEPRGLKWQAGSDFSQRSILCFQLGGEMAAKAGLHSVDGALQDLASLGMASGYEDLSQIQNWSLSPWSLGGRSYSSPGQVAAFGGSLAEPQCHGQWQFAGEATSLQWQGTMNGAVESAFNAFKNLVKNDFQKRS